jgi:hypothetical protein
MPKPDIIKQIEGEVPGPKLDQEIISDLASIVGVNLPAFSRDEDINSCDKTTRYIDFIASLSKVLLTFYKNAVDERAKASVEESRRAIDTEADRRLERAIECASFLAEFLRDLEAPDADLALDYIETAEEAADIIEDAGAALKSYKRDRQMRQAIAPSRRGRKSNDSLRSLVFGLVCLYERYSGKCFTFFRHRERGEYVAVTDGHRFVLRAAQVWIGNAIDSKSLAIECERVNTHWKRMFTSAPKNSSRTPRKISRASSE